MNIDSQSINCHLLITSTEKNARLTLYAQSSGTRSRIIEAGTIYLATQAELGTSSGSRARENLIKDVPLKASINFDQVSLEVNKIEVMEIILYSGNNKIPLEFRDVPLSD
ncbi:MAG: hypothetical protein AAGJ08_17790 [Cyanobacteria bacterium P01_H01_bin.35]